MTRALSIRRAILFALRDAHPFLIPEVSLFADANLRLPDQVSKIEFDSAMAELEGQKRIFGVPQEEIDQVKGKPLMKWKITDNGLARAAELG
jgi:hypothetical protein